MEESPAASDDPRCRDQLRGARRTRPVGGPSARRATRGLDEVKPLGQKLAEAGHRVLVYDRLNCGASGISFDGGNSENEVWADDLHALLLELDAAPAFIDGSSSGCRLALLAALRQRRERHRHSLSPADRSAGDLVGFPLEPRLRTAPSYDAAGSVRRWVSPR